MVTSRNDHYTITAIIIIFSIPENVIYLCGCSDSSSMTSKPDSGTSQNFITNCSILSSRSSIQQQITQLLRDNPQTQYLKSMIFSPYEPFEVAGVSTRSGAPYFLINVAPTKQLGKSHQDLKKTKYFDSFSDEDKQRLNVPKK